MSNRSAQLAKLRQEFTRAAAFNKASQTQLDKAARELDVLETADLPFADDLKPIARLNTVPYQIVTGKKVKVEVLAFHAFGIKSVEFVVGDHREVVTGPGPVYQFTFDTSEMYGPIEVSAYVHPVKGQERALAGPLLWRERDEAGDWISGYHPNGEHSLFLFVANGPTGVRYVSNEGDDATGDGTREAPFATTDRAVYSLRNELGRDISGATIRFEPGEYLYGRHENQPRLDTHNAWLTLEPAEGVGRDEVAIIDNFAGHGFDTHRVRLHNLTVRTSIKAAVGHAKDIQAMLWFDGCLLEGRDPSDDVRFAPPTSWIGGVYATDTTIRNTVYGSLGWAFARNLLIDNISGDAFRSAYHVVDCEVRNLVSDPGSGIHRDVCQWFGAGYENVIVYGLTATENVRAQPLFSRRNTSSGEPDGSMDNVALVNLLLYSESHSGQWLQRTNHLLMRNVSVTGKPFLVANDPANTDGNLLAEVGNWSLEDVTFDRLSWSSGVPIVGPIIFRNVRGPGGDPITVEREGVEVRD